MYEELEHDDGSVTRYRKHVNGRGRIASNAMVDPDGVHRVERVRRGGGHDRPSGADRAGSWVDREATVGAGAQIGTGVRIGPAAVVGAGSKIGSHSRIGASARIAAGVSVGADSVVLQERPSMGAAPGRTARPESGRS